MPSQARDQEVRQAERDAEKLRVALERQRIELTGSVEERLALKEMQDRERWVEICQQQAVRRMKNRELAVAWATWQEVHFGKVRQLQLLAAAGARLQRSMLVAALAHWRDDWEATEERKLRHALASKHMDASRRAVELEEHIVDLKVEHAAALSAAERTKRAALAELRVRLAGSTEERLAGLEAQAAAERIELYGKQAVRRMRNQGVGAAWVTWEALYSERLRQVQLLAGAGARLSKPRLTAAFAQWFGDWEAAQASELRRSMREQIVGKHHRVGELEAEIAEARLAHGKPTIVYWRENEKQ